MRLTLSPPLIVTPDLQPSVRLLHAAQRIRVRVPRLDLARDHVKADAAKLRRRSGEVAVDNGVGQAKSFEHLGAGVRGDRRDAHLRHHLQHALAERLHQVVHRGVTVDAGDRSGARHVLDGLHREVRVDRRCAVSDQQRDVMHLTHVASLNDESDLRTRLLADEVMVHGSRQQKRRDRRALAIGVAIGQHNDASATRRSLPRSLQRSR